MVQSIHVRNLNSDHSFDLQSAREEALTTNLIMVGQIMVDSTLIL